MTVEYDELMEDMAKTRVDARRQQLKAFTTIAATAIDMMAETDGEVEGIDLCLKMSDCSEWTMKIEELKN
jgi:hypothetical protein